MQRKNPKGKLLLIGGAEDKGGKEAPSISEKIKNFEHFEILKEIIPDKKKSRKIEIVTAATAYPDELNKIYKEAFSEAGYKKTDFIHVANNMEAANEKLIERIKKSHAVLFTGGDQFTLATIIGNTPLLDAIMEKYYEDPDFIIAGTSAGAMAAATLMMFEAENNEALLKGTVKISSGLGFVNSCLIDTHFVKRGRFGRLAQAVVMNPTCVGIGIGEDTAILIKKGNEAQCLGSGMVTIIDGRDIRHTNIAYAEEHAPLCIENLRVHILCRGNGFLLEERKIMPSPEDLKKEKCQTA